MRKATKDRFSEEFEFVNVPTDELYYKDLQRAVVELPVESTELVRTCFVHRGHPNPTIPQYEFWTCSDVETGLAMGSGKTAQDAIETAKGNLQLEDAIKRVVYSVKNFIDENGKANLVPNKPVIREETVIFWHDPDLKWAPVKSKRDHMASGGVACLITHHPTAVVNTKDIYYVWPEREDLCPSN